MGITRYETKDYLESKIIDIDKSTQGRLNPNVA
jgi:hypothetical protein